MKQQQPPIFGPPAPVRLRLVSVESREEKDDSDAVWTGGEGASNGKLPSTLASTHTSPIRKRTHRGDRTGAVRIRGLRTARLRMRSRYRWKRSSAWRGIDRSERTICLPSTAMS